MKYVPLLIIGCLLMGLGGVPATASPPTLNRFEVLKVGKKLPNASLLNQQDQKVELGQLGGKIKILSIVPRLNTPVCDEQTHQFSENNGGLDQEVDIITISTNSTDSQMKFSEKANIHNIHFLSDYPDFNFGNKTGLIYPGMNFLMRTVLVVDGRNIIHYVDFVPGGGVPDVQKALKEARKLLEHREAAQPTDETGGRHDD